MARRLFIPALAALLMVSIAVLPAVGQADDGNNSEITILHDSHFHGSFGEAEGEEFEEGLANIGRYFSLIEQLKDENEHSLYLMNGDDIAPSVYSGVFEPHGIHMVDALNEVTDLIDVNTLGNHEFDFGPDNLREILEVANFPIVSANVRDAHQPDEPFGFELGVETFMTFEVDEVTVGVTGLGPEGMATITSLGDDAVQIPADEALDEVVPQMEAAGADIIVVTSHLCGTDAIALADARDDVDVYAGDHCAAVLEEPYVSDTGAIVSLVGDEFDFLGELTLSVENGEITGHEFTLHDLAEDHPQLQPHPDVQAVVDFYEGELDEALNVVIGERTVDWDTRTTVVRSGENALGNYFTDEMRTAFGGSDIAVTNSGGLRGNQVYEAGEITRREIAEILPFGNRLVQAEIPGETLLEALEHSVAQYPEPSGGFLQISGFEFIFDPAEPAGERVQSVTIDDEPLDPDATYIMATNDFTLGGGDGFEMFEDLTVLVDYNAGPVLDAFIMDQIEARDEPITTDVEGRIQAVAPPVPTDTDACKGGGWRDLGDDAGESFRNQGHCVSFVASEGRARGHGRSGPR